MMNGIYKFLTSYTHLMNNNNHICINFLSKEKSVCFSLDVLKNENGYIFKTMNSFHMNLSRFNKFLQMPTYTDSYGITYYNIIIS